MNRTHLLILLLVTAITGMLTPVGARAAATTRGARGASLDLVGAATGDASGDDTTVRDEHPADAWRRDTRADVPEDPQPDDAFSVLTTQPALLTVLAPEGTRARVEFVGGPAHGLFAECDGLATRVSCEPRFSRLAERTDDRAPVIGLQVSLEGESYAVLRLAHDGGDVTDEDPVADVDRITFVDPWTHVTFGDSFTSGVGIGAGYIPDTSADGWACERSTLAFGYQIPMVGREGTNLDRLSPTVTADHEDSFRFVACSGARLPHLTEEHQSGAPPQLAEADVDDGDPDVDLVTMTLGGNDMAFAGILTHCLTNAWRDEPCNDQPFWEGQTLADLAPRLLGRLRARLAEQHRKIIRRAPNAVILHAGYPQVLDPAGATCYSLTDSERAFLADLTARTNDAIGQSVSEHNGIFVDAEALFADHGDCGADPWINPLRPALVWPPGPTTASFHPDRVGHLAYAAAFTEALDRARSRHGVRLNGLPDIRPRQAVGDRAQRNPTARRSGTTSHPEAVAGDDPGGVMRGRDDDLPRFADAQIAVSSGCPAAAPGDTVTVTSHGFSPRTAIIVEQRDGEAGRESHVAADAAGAVVTHVAVTAGSGLVGATHRGVGADGGVLSSTGVIEIDRAACPQPSPEARIDGVDVQRDQVTVDFSCRHARRCAATLDLQPITSGQPATLAVGPHALVVVAEGVEGGADVVEQIVGAGVPLTPTLGAVGAGRAEIVVSRPADDLEDDVHLAVSVTQEGQHPTLETGTIPAGRSQTTLPVALAGGGRTALTATVASPTGWGTEVLQVQMQTPLQINRVMGASRHETAAALAHLAFPHGAGTVLVARADDPADALSAAPLAKALGAPVLLTDRHRLNDETADAIQTLGASTVMLLGGLEAIGPRVEAEVGGLVGAVDRIGGVERTETAALLTRQVEAVRGTGTTAFLVPAREWQPALVASGLAAAMDAPILLVEADGLSTHTRDVLLRYDRVQMVGGIGDRAVDDVRRLRLGMGFHGGSDGVALSHGLADAAQREGAGRTMLVATADTPADALAASGATGAMDATVVLFDGDDQRLLDWLSLAERPSRVVLLGGPDAIPRRTQIALENA